MRLSELKCKEVINEKDGKRLGNITDIIFDAKTGCIESVIIPGQVRLCNMFGKAEEYIIPYKCICQVGEDVVLVCIDADKFAF
jgi:YlmC/YmxH family sporulation protein